MFTRIINSKNRHIFVTSFTDLIVVAHHIQTLIAQGEHQHLDFKFEISDARKIAKSFVAFANTGGGKLLIGVKDNGVIAGIRTEEEQYMAEAAASYYCTPPVPYSLCKWEREGKTVLEVDIPEGTRKPYYVKQKDASPVAYVRVADENMKACNVQIIAWKRQQHPEGLLIVDTENKSRLLDYLKIHICITFSAVCKLLIMSRKKAEQLLADLVYLNILEVEYSSDKVLFRMKQSQ